MSRPYMPVSPLSEDYGTPKEIFDKLNDEFKFTLDVAASDKFHVCENYITKDHDALNISWAGHVCFCNPPYNSKDLLRFSVKAIYEAEQNDVTTVMLVPPKTDQVWWQVLWGHSGKPGLFPSKTEYRFIRGRVRFVKNEVVKKTNMITGKKIYLNTGVQKQGDSSPFPSVIVIVRPNRD